MRIRQYEHTDALELWQLFFETIRRVNSQDYTPAQVEAWAPRKYDEWRWQQRMQRLSPYVCIRDDRIAGYADLQDSGLINHFFVRHDCQRQGVGHNLYQFIEQEAWDRNIWTLVANVSLTARSFFEAMGFDVVAEQEVTVGTERLNNLRMKKQLTSSEIGPIG